MGSEELEKEIVRLSEKIDEISSDIEILKKLKIANECIAQGKEISNE